MTSDASVIFRVDSSAKIGTGHFRRCRSLAAGLTSFGVESAFICRDLGAPYTKTEEIAELHLLQKPDPNSALADSAIPHAEWGEVDQRDDAAEFIRIVKNQLSGNEAEWIVIDHYAFDATWHDYVRQELGCKIAVVDDLADRKLSADLLIDHNWHENHSSKYQGLLQRNCEILGGPKFALLDPAFSAAKKYAFNETVGSIGVFMGGADRVNATGDVLEAVRLSQFEGPVEIVTTSANPHLDSIAEEAALEENWSVSIDLPNLADFFARHDLQIGAGGGATWERCCIGAPTIAMACAENQKTVLEPLSEMAVLRYSLAQAADSLTGEIKEMQRDQRLRKKISKNAMSLVDGRGANRVSTNLATTWLRLARPEDAELVFPWRNAESTRRYIHDPTPLQLPDHQKWWANTLNDPSRVLLIMNIGKRAVGVLRYDFGPTEALVSIYLDPEMTGMGLGNRLLFAGTDWIRSHRSATKSIVAEIDPRNTASRSAFLKVGFVEDGDVYRLDIEEEVS